MMPVADPDAVHAVRNFIKKELALQLKDDLLAAVSGTGQVAVCIVILIPPRISLFPCSC